MKYEYKFVPVSQMLTKKSDDVSMGQTLANYIKEKVDKEATDGWEYYRSDNYIMHENRVVSLLYLVQKNKWGIIIC